MRLLVVLLSTGRPWTLGFKLRTISLGIKLTPSAPEEISLWSEEARGGTSTYASQSDDPHGAARQTVAAQPQRLPGAPATTENTTTHTHTHTTHHTHTYKYNKVDPLANIIHICNANSQTNQNQVRVRNQTITRDGAGCAH